MLFYDWLHYFVLFGLGGTVEAGEEEEDSVSDLRAGNQRFLSELLVYLKNCPPRLVLLFLTSV